MDDPRSDAYNTFISTQGMPLPASVGIARRETVFELMLFVMHNTSPVLRGAGSCVFLHVWAKPDQPTQGCVAMSRESLAELLPWLDLDRRPVLVQLPAPIHGKFRVDWSLPDID
jgi:L,D-peptidoglycan transpeptidase YkuD (ErfK/YbiS/YcfS/YnhG family)